MNAGEVDITEFLLKFIKPKPGMYLTSPKLLYLKIFLTGYTLGAQQNMPNNEDRFLSQFQDWFIQRVNGSKYTMWYPSILEEAEHSEEKALQRFWEYLEEFDKETGGSATF
jgi:hypothetical protein